jgi:hypothetical protein
MGFWNRNKSEEAKAVPATQQEVVMKSEPKADRAKLVEITEALANVTAAVAELEQRRDRFTKVIAENEATQARLTASIEADGGRALDAALSGSGSDELSDLMATAEANSKAATGAKAGLPVIERQLEHARAELKRLEGERYLTTREVLIEHADKIGAEYKATYEKLADLHDTLVAVSMAVPPGSHGEPAIQMVDSEFELPRFFLPSVRDKDEFLGTFKHRSDPTKLERIAGHWSEAFARVATDVNADITDLTGVV